MKKQPSECSSLQDIRDEIDAIDHEITFALGRRLEYVKAASAFKPNLESIPAPERVAAMLPQRRLWAEQAGLEPDFFENIFSQLIQWFINEQVRFYRSKQKKVNGNEKPD